MAKAETIYKLSITISDVDRSVYETVSLVAVQHPSETLVRMAARIIAFASCYSEGIVFTRGLCVPDEPSVWLKDYSEQVLHWIDVGLPEALRLEKASRLSEQVSLFSYGSAFAPWYEKNRAALAKISSFSHYLLEEELLDQIAQRIVRNAEINITLSDGMLYVTVADWSGQQALPRLEA